MELKTLLTEKKVAIVEQWLGKFLESYPADSSNFLKNSSSRFRNPIGFTASKGLGEVFSGLIDGGDLEDLGPALESIVRIRAVSELSASQSLSFIFHLKGILRDALGAGAAPVAAELASLDTRIDALGLMAFDIFMKCREKIYDIKTRETRNSMLRLLQRANIIMETQQRDSGQDSPASDTNKPREVRQ